MFTPLSLSLGTLVAPRDVCHLFGTCLAPATTSRSHSTLNAELVVVPATPHTTHGIIAYK
jgi:hypothetical protein